MPSMLPYPEPRFAVPLPPPRLPKARPYPEPYPQEHLNLGMHPPRTLKQMLTSDDECVPAHMRMLSIADCLHIFPILYDLSDIRRTMKAYQGKEFDAFQFSDVLSGMLDLHVNISNPIIQRTRAVIRKIEEEETFDADAKEFDIAIRNFNILMVEKSKYLMEHGEDLAKFRYTGMPPVDPLLPHAIDLSYANHVSDFHRPKN